MFIGLAWAHWERTEICTGSALATLGPALGALGALGPVLGSALELLAEPQGRTGRHTGNTGNTLLARMGRAEPEAGSVLEALASYWEHWGSY